MSNSEQGRPCNAFEEFFVKHNIRFAILLSMTMRPLPMEQVQRAVVKALDSVPLGQYEIAKARDETSSYGLYRYSPETTTTSNICVVELQDCNDTPEELLEKRVVETDKNDAVPAEGGVHVELLASRKNENKATSCVGVILNVCHALCDGRALVDLASRIQQHVVSDKDASESIVRSTTTFLPRDWKDLVHQAWSEIRKQQQNDNNKLCYLPVDGTMLSIQDIVPTTDETSLLQATLRHEVTHVSLIAGVLRKQARKVTMTGMLAATLMASLAKEYHDTSNSNSYQDKVVGISIQVDLRPYLLPENSSYLPQAFGSVVVAMPCKVFQEVDSFPVFMEIAAEVTNQLQVRIQRGEAHATALAAMDSSNCVVAAPPDATLELSNVGLFHKNRHDNNKAFPQLYVTQRFDDYDGVSCMMHSEADSNVMRWATGVGIGLDHYRMESILSRATAWMQLVTDM